MMISERIDGSITILDLVGPLTSADGAGNLRGTVRHLLQQGRHQIVVSLGAVPYMDSTGLGELIEAWGMTRRQGGELKLANVTPRLRDLFAVTKLAYMLELFDSESAAKTSFH